MTLSTTFQPGATVSPLAVQAAALQAYAEWQEAAYATARSWVANFSRIGAPKPVALPIEYRRLVMTPEQYLDVLENSQAFSRRLHDINQAYLNDVTDLVNETRASFARSSLKATRRPV